MYYFMLQTPHIVRQNTEYVLSLYNTRNLEPSYFISLLYQRHREVL